MENSETTQLVQQAALQALSEGMGLSEFVSLARVEAIKVAIRQNSGNQCKAAGKLKIHRNTIQRALHPDYYP